MKTKVQKGFYLLATLLVGTFCSASLNANVVQDKPTTAYDFTFKDLNKAPLNLNDYQGKVILVVNTASNCGFTPQYAALQSLYNDYKDQGLVVVGIPSPDFGHQEFDDNDKIKSFTKEKFAITFPLASPEHVKGEQAHPFYVWAGQQVGFMGKPKWNFHKYLIGRDGKLVTWFPSTTSPDSEKVKVAIATALSKPVTTKSAS